MFRNGNGAKESDLADFVPSAPFPGIPIIEANDVGTSIGQAKVLVFIERKAEGLPKDIGGFTTAGQPFSQPNEDGGPGTKIGGAGKGGNIGDACRFGWSRPDEGRRGAGMKRP